MTESSAAWELWGTFSVADHLRKRAFLADVLIYDRLIVPVPPTNSDEMTGTWQRRWDPERQAQLLGVIRAANEDLVMEVPWDSHQQARWETYAEGDGDQRLSLARRASSDVADVQGRRAANPDSPAQFSERTYLVDYHNSRNDALLASGIPPRTVSIVAAYGSFEEFSRDVPVEPVERTSSGPSLLSAFALPLLVPESSRRSDLDLLKEALDLAAMDKWQECRAAYHIWRREAVESGFSNDEAQRNLVDRMAEYEDAVRRSSIQTTIRLACLVLVDVAAAAASEIVGGPTIAAIAAGTGTGLAAFLDRWRWKTTVPPKLMAGAMFHDARTRFR
jgi:hypothetical protein